MKPSELQAVIQEVKESPLVINYQEVIRTEIKATWFRRRILPIVLPLIEKLLREYLEIAVRAAIKILIEKKKI